MGALFPNRSRPWTSSGFGPTQKPVSEAQFLNQGPVSESLGVPYYTSIHMYKYTYTYTQLLHITYSTTYHLLDYIHISTYHAVDCNILLHFTMHCCVLLFRETAVKLCFTKAARQTRDYYTSPECTPHSITTIVPSCRIHPARHLGTPWRS